MLYLCVQWKEERHFSYGICLFKCRIYLSQIYPCFLFLIQGPGQGLAWEMRTVWGSRKQDKTGGGWGGQEEDVEDRKRTRRDQEDEDDSQEKKMKINMIFNFGTCRVLEVDVMKIFLVFLFFFLSRSENYVVCENVPRGFCWFSNVLWMGLPFIVCAAVNNVVWGKKRDGECIGGYRYFKALKQ